MRFLQGKEIPNIITEPFTNAFGLIGGGWMYFAIGNRYSLGL